MNTAREAPHRSARSGLHRLARLMLSPAAAIALVCLLIGPLARAAQLPPAPVVIIVSSTCSLLDAVRAANTGVATCGCPAGNPGTGDAGADVIEIPEGTVLPSFAAVPGIESTSLLLISSTITINAHGQTVIGNAAATNFRVVRVTSDGVLTVNNLGFTGGRVFDRRGFVGNGGGFLNEGTLTLNDCVLTDNSATRGGGIYNQSRLTLNRTTLSNNRRGGGSQSAGGGIYSTGVQSDVRIERSVLSGTGVDLPGSSSVGLAVYAEGASSGGAFAPQARFVMVDSLVTGSRQGYDSAVGSGDIVVSLARLGTVTVRNSTFSGNLAGSSTLAVGNRGATELSQLTIVGNSGRALGVTVTPAVLRNSLLAGNGSTGTLTPNAFTEIQVLQDDTPVSTYNNLFGDNSRPYAEQLSPAFVPGPGDRFGSSDRENLALGAILNPALADNGGPTQTHALVASSVAVNPVRAAGDPVAPLRRDQRGQVPNAAASPPDTIRDTGAFEFDAIDAVAPSAPNALAATGGDGSLSIRFTPGDAGTAPIGNYSYALGDSTLFTALDPADGSSPVTIPGLANGTAVTVRLKAISPDGESPASEAVTGTPAALVNGACGGASGVIGTATAPAEFLCASGTATATAAGTGIARSAAAAPAPPALPARCRMPRRR